MFYKLACTRDPKNLQNHEETARIANIVGDHASRLEALKIIARLRPCDLNVAIRRAKCLLELNKPKQVRSKPRDGGTRASLLAVFVPACPCCVRVCVGFSPLSLASRSPDLVFLITTSFPTIPKTFILSCVLNLDVRTTPPARLHPPPSPLHPVTSTWTSGARCVRESREEISA